MQFGQKELTIAGAGNVWDRNLVDRYRCPMMLDHYKAQYLPYGKQMLLTPACIPMIHIIFYRQPQKQIIP